MLSIWILRLITSHLCAKSRMWLSGWLQRECFFTFQIIQSTNAYRDPTMGQAWDQVLGSRDEDVLTWSWRCSWARGQGEELYWVTTKSNTASLLIRTPGFQEPEMSFSAIICHSHNYTSSRYNYPHFKDKIQDLPGDPVVKNLPANAGDTGSIPGPGWSHMLQSPCATAAEPICCSFWSLHT